jgi:hypothetical protein
LERLVVKILGGIGGDKFRALQAGGHRFDPGHVPQNLTYFLFVIYAATPVCDFALVFLGALEPASPLFSHSPDGAFGRSKPYFHSLTETAVRHLHFFYGLNSSREGVLVATNLQID